MEDNIFRICVSIILPILILITILRIRYNLIMEPTITIISQDPTKCNLQKAEKHSFLDKLRKMLKRDKLLKIMFVLCFAITAVCIVGVFWMLMSRGTNVFGNDEAAYTVFVVTFFLSVLFTYTWISIFENKENLPTENPQKDIENCIEQKAEHTIEEDDSYYEQEAIERGLSIEQLKAFLKLERENAELRRQMQENTVQKAENINNAKVGDISNRKTIEDYSEDNTKRIVQKIVETWNSVGLYCGAHKYDVLIVQIFSFIDKVRKLEFGNYKSIFTNKYVCTDTALFLGFVSMTFMSIKDIFPDSDFLEKIYFASLDIYNINSKEGILLHENRSELFYCELQSHEDPIAALSVIAKEMKTVFEYDLYYNKYVKYCKGLPHVMVEEWDKILLIAEESKVFFNNIIPAIAENIDKYLYK